MLVASIVLVLIVPYLLWHRPLDAYFASADFQRWLVDARSYAWMIGVGLIVGDLLLPIPVVPVMATLGAMYGAAVGGIIATSGSILAGLCAYGASRLLGLRAGRLFASEQELDDLQGFFDTWGAAGIIASRALPVVPEVMTVLAGLSRMHFGRFLLALCLGSIPVGFSLAWLGGSAGIRSSFLFLLTLIPVCAWCAYLVLKQVRSGRCKHACPRGERGGP
jgi:uncharacterized membrane protein YdjX (TVP38/TMEM64 family)